jgi:hypothetical protein
MLSRSNERSVKRIEQGVTRGTRASNAWSKEQQEKHDHSSKKSKEEQEE